MLGHPLLLWEGERDDDGDCDDYSDKDHIDNSYYNKTTINGNYETEIYI